MNFIISFALWIVLFLTSTLLKQYSSTSLIDVFTACQVIFALLFIFFLIFAVFYNINKIQELNQLLNKIHSIDASIRIAQNEFDTMRDFYEEYLVEKYPNLEKEMISKITEGQPKEDLIMFIQQFPELISSKSILIFTENIKTLSNKCYELLELKIHYKRLFHNVKTDQWVVFKSKIILIG